MLIRRGMVPTILLASFLSSCEVKGPTEADLKKSEVLKLEIEKLDIEIELAAKKSATYEASLPKALINSRV